MMESAQQDTENPMNATKITQHAIEGSKVYFYDHIKSIKTCNVLFLPLHISDGISTCVASCQAGLTHITLIMLYT